MLAFTFPSCVSVQANIRAAAQTALDAWAEQAKAKEMVEGDMCVDALKTGSVLLKAALFPWIGQILTDSQFATFT